MLEGIRVLDLSRVIAGPHCAMLLGDLGADVVKLERPGRGDDLRDWSGVRGSPGMSAVFAAVNRNKRGVAVDLQHPEGARLALALARRADVVVENLAATLGLLPDPVAHYFHSTQRPPRVGNRNPNLTPAEAFPTKDGHVNVVLMNREQWDRFCRVLGDEVLRTDPRLAENAGRLAHH